MQEKKQPKRVKKWDKNRRKEKKCVLNLHVKAQAEKGKKCPQ